LDSACTAAEVVVVAQDFVAQFSDDEIEALPRRCRPGRIRNAHDVRAYSFRVVRNHRAGGSETAARIHKLASFSSDASLRLSQLTAGYGVLS
jgi:hypothetical protein